MVDVSVCFIALFKSCSLIWEWKKKKTLRWFYSFVFYSSALKLFVLYYWFCSIAKYLFPSSIILCVAIKSLYRCLLHQWLIARVFGLSVVGQGFESHSGRYQSAKKKWGHILLPCQALALKGQSMAQFTSCCTLRCQVPVEPSPGMFKAHIRDRNRALWPLLHKKCLA